MISLGRHDSAWRSPGLDLIAGDNLTQSNDTQTHLSERIQAHMLSLQRELAAVERSLQDAAVLNEILQGQTLIYVGGRPGSYAALRALVKRARGELLHHVGIVDEGRRGAAFAALLCQADRVLCPLDMIDPDSLLILRHLCARHHVPWLPLRTSSVASFIGGILRETMPRSRCLAARTACCPR